MRVTLILVFLASLVGFFLTLLLVSTHQTDTFDRAGIQLVQSFSSPFLTWIMVFVSAFGNGVFTVFTFFAFAFALLLKGYRRQSHFSFLIWLALLLSWLAKLIIARPRPDGYLLPEATLPSDFSFPSGHVVFYTVFFGLVAFYALVLPDVSKLGRSVLLIISGLLIGLVGLSRIYLGVHYPTDVIGGYLLGLLLLGVLAVFYFKFILPKESGE
ncbi:MAG: phosphatase PAP2 family protein [bacterium]|nr:phosphatase PAP2 family protein [bacterium]